MFLEGLVATIIPAIHKVPSVSLQPLDGLSDCHYTEMIALPFSRLALPAGVETEMKSVGHNWETCRCIGTAPRV